MENSNHIPNQNSQVKPVELKGIQYLRGIAALLVILCHVNAMVLFPQYFDTLIFKGLLLPGAVGVELFFVISGFIIVYVSLNQETLLPKIEAFNFMWRRFVRIVPFMWVCILGYASLRVLGRGLDTFSLSEYTRAMVLFPIGSVQPTVIWTLRFEFLFYAVFCLTIIYFSSRWLVLLAWFITPFLWYVMTTQIFQTKSHWMELGDFFFSKLILLFGLGTLLGILYLKNKIKFKFHNKHGFLLCLVATTPLFLAALYTGIGFEQDEKSFLSVFLTGALSFLLVILAISIQPEQSTTFINRLGLLLGNASYSIYLTHSAVISAILGFWSKFQSSPNEYLLVVVITFCCCFCGILVHKTIEKPLVVLIQSYSKKLNAPKSELKLKEMKPM